MTAPGSKSKSADEIAELQRRYDKAMSDPAVAKAWERDAKALAGDWRAIGGDLQHAIDKVGRTRCVCGLTLAEHLDGGACGAFEEKQ